MERESEVTATGQIRSELRIPEVNRAHHMKAFSCKAQNNNQQRPLSQEVIIDMNCECVGRRRRWRRRGGRGEWIFGVGEKRGE